MPRTCPGARPFIAAAVATGMNAGVSNEPCGVVTRPSRAAPVDERARISKRMAHRCTNLRRGSSGTELRRAALAVGHS
ncbi:MAG: hypothetical protein U0575_16805 [Phycisphaerales bacterium]